MHVMHALRTSARVALATAALAVLLVLGMSAAAGAASQYPNASAPTTARSQGRTISPACIYLLVGIVGGGAAFTGRRVRVRGFE